MKLFNRNQVVLGSMVINCHALDICVIISEMTTASSGLLAAILLLARPAACLSSKKGLGVSRRTFQCGDLEAFNGVSWYYNWGPDNVMADCQELSQPQQINSDLVV